MHCWRVVNWTVCLVAVRLCTAGGLWTELCVWLQWGYVLLEYCELNCDWLQCVYIDLTDFDLSRVSGCSLVLYSWGIMNWIVCLVVVWLYTTGGSELNCVSGCFVVIYSWRIVNWTVCLLAVKLCTACGSELNCVWLQWGYVLLADCEPNCVWLQWIFVLLAGLNWNLCLVAVRLCTPGGLWIELFVSSRGEIMYCLRILNLTQLWHNWTIPRGKLIFIGGYNGTNIIKLLINIFTSLSFALSLHPSASHPFKN